MGEAAGIFTLRARFLPLAGITFGGHENHAGDCSVSSVLSDQKVQYLWERNSTDFKGGQ